MVIKVHRNSNYTVMSNIHLQDRTLSLKAKGLLSVMLSLPPDWDYSVNGLVAICEEKKTAVNAALNELRYHGYLVVTKLYSNQTESGRFEYTYDIYEEPQKPRTGKPVIEKPDIENLCLENPVLENPTQLNTKEQNTKRLNTKEQRFIPPTVEEVRQYCLERKNGVDPGRFCNFYASKGWMVGRNKMKDWKAAVRTWERPIERTELDDKLDEIL